ncbi:PCYCGC domain-containing protein [Neobacillus mesonae]|nr:PCYCGC domain-containing protein [Neobacillus mesonae]
MKPKTYGFLFTGLMVGSLVLAACGEKDAAHDHSMHGKDNEQYEASASMTEMPAFLAKYTDNTQTTYTLVREVKEELKMLNCYCGCMDYDNAHDSLFRCFIASEEEGEVTWTDHGAQCGICLEELKDTARLKSEGKSIEEIQKFIDDKYAPDGAPTSSEVHPVI